MNAALTLLAAWLVDFAALASVLLAVAIGARWLVRGLAERMAIDWSAWLGLALLAAFTALPGWPRLALFASHTLDEPSEMKLLPPVELQVEPLAEESMPSSRSEVSELNPDAPALTVSEFRQTWIVTGWLVTALCVLAWIGLGMVQTWRLLWQASEAPGWIAGELRRLVAKRGRVPGLLLSGHLSSAAAIGALRPRIVLPQAAADESCATAVRAALAHEWAHIRHGDLWLLALERLLVPLLAWHPLFWILRRNVRLDQELLADADAAGEKPIEYAEALVAWAKSARPAPLGLAALSLWESPHTLSRRITMLLDPNRAASRTASRGWQLILAAAVLGFVGGLSLITFRPLTADEPVAVPPPAAASRQTAPDDAALAEPGAQAQVDLQCIVVEVPVDVLPEVLPEVNSRPQPSPGLAVVVRSPQAWREALEKFQNDARTSVISQPRVSTLDGQNAMIQIAVAGLPLPEEEATKSVPDSGTVLLGGKQAGLSIHLTPHVLKQPGDRRLVRIDFKAKQGDLATEDHPRVVTTREFQTSAMVPDGMTLIVADRSRAAAGAERGARAADERKVLVVAIEMHLVAAPGPSPQPEPAPHPQSGPARGEPSPDFSKLFQGPLDDEAKLKAYLLRQIETLKQLHETDHNRLQAASREFDARFAQLQSLAQAVQQYDRDRDETGLIKRQLTELRMQIDRLISQSGSERPSPTPARAGSPPAEAPEQPAILKITLQNATAEKVASALRTLKWESAGPSLDLAIKTREIEGQLNAAQESLSAVHQQLTNPHPNLTQQERVRLQAEEAKLRPQIQSLHDQLRLLRERGASGATSLRVSADPATNSVSVFGPPAALEAAKAVAQSLDQPSQPSSSRIVAEQPIVNRPAWQTAQADANASSRADDRETQIKLMELDLKDAEVSLEAAKAELEASMEIRQTNPRAVSAAEITKAQLGVRRAEIQVEKMKLLLGGLKKQPGGQAPNNDRRTPPPSSSEPVSRPR
jgi:beta-lactamase regulating signal transducer with metallopeptidase domain